MTAPILITLAVVGAISIVIGICWRRHADQRLVLTFPAEAWERLGDVAHLDGAENRTELIRRALRHYDGLVLTRGTVQALHAQAVDLEHQGTEARAAGLHDRARACFDEAFVAMRDAALKAQEPVRCGYVSLDRSALFTYAISLAIEAERADEAGFLIELARREKLSPEREDHLDRLASRARAARRVA